MPQDAFMQPDFSQILLKDRYPLQREWQHLQDLLKNDSPEAIQKARIQLEKISQRAQASGDVFRMRKEKLLRIEYPAELPIASHADEISKLIEKHQVVIVAGETGSGKPRSWPRCAWPWEGEGKA